MSADVNDPTAPKITPSVVQEPAPEQPKKAKPRMEVGHPLYALSKAYDVVYDSIVEFNGKPVGTKAAVDDTVEAANYEEVFVRDFFPCGLIFLQDGHPEIVKNFLTAVLQARSQNYEMVGHQALPGIMPASFKVVREGGKDVIRADFGDIAIGRVAPVDSMMWWILLLDLYRRMSGDIFLHQSDEFQWGVRSIIKLFLRDRYEVFPTLLVPDGACMIDRRMSIYGHPIEIQSLFFATLRVAQKLLVPGIEKNDALIDTCARREKELTNYVRRYYWMDIGKLNEIHRYSNEEFGHDISNVLNIYPESIPDWIMDWLPDDAGYFVGNLGPGRMDCRYYALGNLLASIFGLMPEENSQKLMNLYETRWKDLVGGMPVKILYPAMEGDEWRMLTGSDPKNAAWSYHNGGSWPVLLWPFVGAAVAAGREDLARQARDLAAKRLIEDNWPEYYDGKAGRLIGRRSNFRQVWSAAAFILADRFLQNPSDVRALRVGA